MSMDGLTELASGAGHPGALSESERDNRVRFRPELAGHVESHFLKANSPDGSRALWIKHTLLAPRDRREPPRAEVWAVAFAAYGARKIAEKRSYPLSEASIREQPFAIRTPCATLTHGALAGALDTIRWELRFSCPERAFRPFPIARMYTGAFPRSKSLTPAPDSRAHGRFEVWGETWEIDGWRAAQGHNWGSSHAHAYAWAHCNAWEDAEGHLLDGVWFESLTGRVRLGGPLISPWLSVAALAVDGRLLRFDGPRALLSRRVSIDTRCYELELRRPGAALSARFEGRSEQFAGLRYEDPDGKVLACLNAKLARGYLELRRNGKIERFYARQAALELGTRRPGHGVPLLA